MLIDSEKITQIIKENMVKYRKKALESFQQGNRDNTFYFNGGVKFGEDILKLIEEEINNELK